VKGQKTEVEPHGFTAVAPPCFGETPPKHHRQNTAGLPLAFIPTFTGGAFCEGGVKTKKPYETKLPYHFSLFSLSTLAF